MPVADYMALCNAHYYATRDPLGAAGDFVTAPEISQMFGELVGLCLADLWRRAGEPAVRYVELGPGRGTLAMDALRAMARAGLVPPVDLVETSPVLRARQRAQLPGASHHDDVATVPADVPLLVVANEFFDALPIRQLVRTVDGWRERMVDTADDGFGCVAGGQRFDTIVPARLADAPEGSVIETSPASIAVMDLLTTRIVAQGGALLAIDYGYAGPMIGDTLQAVVAHRFADPFGRPGEHDLTAHVDFAALGEAAARCGAVVHGPMEQGAWLTALGIDARASALAAQAPARESEIATARARLVEGTQMGRLFKVLGVTAPGWPVPAGLA